MTAGKVTGTGAYGVYAAGITKIYGGRIEGKTYGVYGYNDNKVTIGKQEDELNTTNPAIYGATYGIGMRNTTYSFNFYNGAIISNTKETAYNSIVNLREKHMTYTYFDNEIEKKYCTILIPTVENITMEATPTEYTNQNVKVKITYPYVEGITRQYSEDGEEWKQAEQYIQELIVTENKTIYARTLNESGIITEENQIEINNIDKEKPTVTVVPTTTNYLVADTNETKDITLTITSNDTGVSGLDKMQYAWAKEGEEIKYIDFEREITINKTKLPIGQYNLYINITDKAGNKSELTQIRYNVKYQDPVAQIGETKYVTIQEAIEACSKEAGETQTTITIIKNTDEEFRTYEGQNIMLDLNGKTVGSSSQETPICTNNGTLQIINGKLESLNGTAIENNGTLTIGDKNTEIDNDNPTIYGKKTGIKNTNILNFYDGKIKGISPIQGKVTETPEEYGPVSTGYENGITTVQLGIVSGYVARIEWVYYTTLQEAIDATKINTNNPDTVTIIKDIQLHEILEVNPVQNVILDLNGYTLTITGQDRVINNNGNLEITDSSKEQIGKIIITSTNNCYGLYNNSKGNIKVIGGTVSSINNNSNYVSYGIYNASTGSIEIMGGTVSSSGSSSSSNSYGIYNANIGNIKVVEGTVSSKGYGIYNKSTGKVEVIGGTVSSSNNYGIYNAGTGTIEIIGGLVTGGRYGIYNANTANIEVVEGTVSSNNYGIYNKSTGNVKVTGGVISSSINSDQVDNYGIYNASIGNVVIEGGIISISNTSNNSTTSKRTSYGIYNASTGNIKIGKKENEIISQEELVIKGGHIKTATSHDGCGIYNKDGMCEFYNGMIQGSSTALIGNITQIRNEYKIENNAIEGKDSIYLVPNISEEYVAQIDNEKYYKLNDAIESVKENEEKTIQILRDFELNEEKTIVFDKDIILDLNGYTITNRYYKIENTGNLKIIDNSESKDGKIECINTIYGIYNTSAGNIQIVEGIVSSSGSENYSNGYGIYNESTGKVEIIGGTVSSNSNGYNSKSYGIFNRGAGDIEITGGTIDSGGYIHSYGIYNESTGKVKITGGTVSCSNYGIYNASTGGNIKITGEIISGKEYGIYNGSAGNIEIVGGTVSSSSSNASYGIYNNSTGIIEITGGTITSSSNKSHSYSYGIYNKTGKVEVIGGIVSSIGNTCYGIFNANTGIIILGEKEDEQVSQESPSIKGEYVGTSTTYKGYGLYNSNGILQYYDGTIRGTTRAISGKIDEVEELTEILVTSETINNKTCETVKLEQKETNPVIINGVEYDSVQKSIEACGEQESTIELLRDVDPGATIIIEENQNITLDLKGYTMKNYPEITNKGTLKIVDTSEGQTGKIIGLTGIAIANSGTMELRGGSITDSGYGIQNTGTLNINGGNITNNTYGIYNGAKGNTIITSGNINSNTYGLYNYSSSSSIDISGGTITSNKYGIYNYDGTSNINEGIIQNNEYGTYTTRGMLNITSVEIASENYGIYNAGGTINLTSTEITGGNYGVYNTSGTTNIKEGSNINSKTGIQNTGGTVNIGEQGTMNLESPIIIGEEYGFVNSATAIVYMYDGKIKGKTGATQGFITHTETGYSVATEIEGEYMVDYLALSGTVTTVAQVNGIDYSNLQSAINSITGEEEQTIKLTNGIITTSTFHIAEGQNIIIDMNGFTISSELENTITNAGSLKIIDTSGKNTAKISNSVGTAIKNTGTLTLGENEGTVNQEILTIEGTTYGIENEGILNFYDGTINGNSAVRGTITNRATGYAIRTTTVNNKERYYLSK